MYVGGRRGLCYQYHPSSTKNLLGLGVAVVYSGDGPVLLDVTPREENVLRPNLHRELSQKVLAG